MAVETHRLTIGDTLTPIGAQLKQQDTNGTLSVVSLSGKTVKFLMVASDGTSIVAETTTGVTVTDATNGKVQYDLQAADVTAITAKGAGTYYAWFRVYSGSEYDTYPVGGRKLVLEFSAAA